MQPICDYNVECHTQMRKFSSKLQYEHLEITGVAETEIINLTEKSYIYSYLPDIIKFCKGKLVREKKHIK